MVVGVWGSFACYLGGVTVGGVEGPRGVGMARCPFHHVLVEKVKDVVVRRGGVLVVLEGIVGPVGAVY